MEKDSINRRRFVRFSFPFTLHMYCGESSAVSVYTEDISTGGIKVALKEPIPIDTVVALEIFVQSPPVKCKGKVVWIEEKNSDYFQDDTYHIIGVEFNDIREVDRLIIKQVVERLQKEKLGQTQE